MQPETRSRRSGRKLLWIGLALVVALGGVTAIGLFTSGGKFRQRPSDDDLPADYTDAEREDLAEYRTRPEKEELERLGGVLTKRRVKKLVPAIEPEVFERLMTLTRHPNLVVRVTAVERLVMYGFAAKRAPYSEDPMSREQMTAVQNLVDGLVEDPSPHLRAWAFRAFGWHQDDRFIDRARTALRSVRDFERKAAEDYLVALAKRKPADK